MKRSLESALVAAVTVVTVLGTMSVLQDKHSGSAIDAWVAAKWRDLHARVVPSMANTAGVDTPSTSQTGKQTPSLAPLVAVSENQSATSNNTSGQSSSGAGQGPTVIATPSGKWTQADVTRLETIGVNLIFALSPTDWQHIAQALSTGESSSVADQTLAQILRQRVPASDRQWLLDHFTGGNAVNQQDVQLLQRSISQAESELTPAERKLLEDELNALEGTTGVAGAGSSGGIDHPRN
ncbi:hypothetical protein [Alicyclobacillus sp. ALC3]|uniref:hypothetical protein n=1 Tax=Alicyclobacillus sp. ALC3 TaxID=2796143 RepID=UPI0023795A6F|nr:hypothetical protein [Alicyclobacillus sp. ALC3]WDL96886.1 hypothetical protein JC200_21830 [Alicyclobacillus sp. ALC3]